eukprot:1158507-Pelagomonas_calceolata.AAC.12
MSPPCGQHCAFCEEAQAVSRTRLLDGIVFDVVDIHRASCNEAQAHRMGLLTMQSTSRLIDEAQVYEVQTLAGRDCVHGQHHALCEEAQALLMRMLAGWYCLRCGEHCTLRDEVQAPPCHWAALGLERPHQAQLPQELRCVAGRLCRPMVQVVGKLKALVRWRAHVQAHGASGGEGAGACEEEEKGKCFVFQIHWRALVQAHGASGGEGAGACEVEEKGKCFAVQVHWRALVQARGASGGESVGTCDKKEKEECFVFQVRWRVLVQAHGASGGENVRCGVLVQAYGASAGKGGPGVNEKKRKTEERGKEAPS